ncbi:hypothetical protein [Melittangium boletus]|uniref:Outer membrane protein beta-barrel domain-containing protein n=1 Tax=Melittangium boletus DSM 14713 TaxID=1294270 RepID=A0A250IJE4_9BACT|nr:hypothetical protein [Melittangium boletus]ATB31368.1 hypothetical protein MEBOL_004830 [Melittangium boletus DSM 14713]
MTILLPRHLPRFPLGRGLLLALLVLAVPAAQAAPARSSKSSKGAKTSRGASKAPAEAPAPAPAAVPAAAPTPAPEVAAEKPAPEPKPVVEPKPVAAVRPAATPRAAAPRAAADAPSAPTTPGRMRLGLGPDLFVESARLNGEQGINASRRDESFDYSSDGFLSATLWLTVPVSTVSERLRAGAGVRIFGNYGAGGDRTYGFGVLNELFVSGEYGLPLTDKMELVLAARVGMSLLVPGREFAEEIDRLQEQGVNVWSVPRVGWLAGPSAGARRRMSERIWLRADVLAHVGQQYLFATSQEISGLQYSKNWSTLALRLGLSLGAEFGF